MMPLVSAVEMTVEDLITEVSGRKWEEVLPYVSEFTVVVASIMGKTKPETVEEIIEIGAAVWASMDAEADVTEVLDGEQAGEVVSLRRHKLSVDVPHGTSRT